MRVADDVAVEEWLVVSVVVTVVAVAVAVVDPVRVSVVVSVVVGDVIRQRLPVHSPLAMALIMFLSSAAKPLQLDRTKIPLIWHLTENLLAGNCTYSLTACSTTPAACWQCASLYCPASSPVSVTVRA